MKKLILILTMVITSLVMLSQNPVKLTNGAPAWVPNYLIVQGNLWFLQGSTYTSLGDSLFKYVSKNDSSLLFYTPRQVDSVLHAYTLCDHDTIIYVSKNTGSDNNIGSASFPYKTIKGALDKMPDVVLDTYRVFIHFTGGGAKYNLSDIYGNLLGKKYNLTFVGQYSIIDDLDNPTVDGSNSWKVNFTNADIDTTDLEGKFVIGSINNTNVLWPIFTNNDSYLLTTNISQSVLTTYGGNIGIPIDTIYFDTRMYNVNNITFNCLNIDYPNESYTGYILHSNSILFTSCHFLGIPSGVSNLTVLANFYGSNNCSINRCLSEYTCSYSAGDHIEFDYCTGGLIYNSVFVNRSLACQGIDIRTSQVALDDNIFYNVNGGAIKMEGSSVDIGNCYVKKGDAVLVNEESEFGFLMSFDQNNDIRVDSVQYIWKESSYNSNDGRYINLHSAVINQDNNGLLYDILYPYQSNYINAEENQHIIIGTGKINNFAYNFEINDSLTLANGTALFIDDGDTTRINSSNPIKIQNNSLIINPNGDTYADKLTTTDSLKSNNVLHHQYTWDIENGKTQSMFSMLDTFYLTNTLTSNTFSRGIYCEFTVDSNQYSGYDRLRVYPFTFNSTNYEDATYNYGGIIQTTNRGNIKVALKGLQSNLTNNIQGDSVYIADASAHTSNIRNIIANGAKLYIPDFVSSEILLTASAGIASGAKFYSDDATALKITMQQDADIENIITNSTAIHITSTMEADNEYGIVIDEGVGQSIFNDKTSINDTLYAEVLMADVTSTEIVNFDNQFSLVSEKTTADYNNASIIGNYDNGSGYGEIRLAVQGLLNANELDLVFDTTGLYFDGGIIPDGINFTDYHLLTKEAADALYGGGSYTFTNGLTETSGTVKLGGTISENSTINLNNYTLSFDGATNYDGNVYFGNINGIDGLFAYTNEIYLDANNYAELYTTSGGSLVLNSTANTFTDNKATKTGLLYAADYSANYTDRSLIDKGYADATYGGVTPQDGIFDWDGTKYAPYSTQSAGTFDNQSIMPTDQYTDINWNGRFNATNIRAKSIISIYNNTYEAARLTESQLIIQDGSELFMSLTPIVTDGSSAIAYTFDTYNTLSTTGAKLMSIKNNGSEKVSIDKDGVMNVSGGINNVKNVAKAEILYSNTTQTTIITLPANAVIWLIAVEVVTGFNDSGTDYLDIGITGSASRYVDDYDQLPSPSFVESYDATLGGSGVTNIPERYTGSTNVTFQYTGQNSDASQGLAYIYITYSRHQ